jgi:glutathione S-transferase
VPVLMLNDGQLLTEGAAMVQYIADLAPESKIAPPQGTFERVRLQEWLNFIATELHKGLGPIFSPEASDEFKASVKKRVAQRFAFMESALANKPFLLGDFSVADGYALYPIRLWQKVALETLTPTLAAYQARIVERTAVRAALEAEGLS